MTNKRFDPAPYAPTPAEVFEEAAAADLELTQPQSKRLAQYLTLLLKWNKVMNLVGRAQWPSVFRDLTADSLHLAVFLKRLALPKAPLTLDLGAGAGLPGIPLRIVWEAGAYVLVELREKRAIFLSQAVAALKLSATYVVHGRAEVVLEALPGLKMAPREGYASAQTLEKADLVVSRAFMPWPQLLPLAAELLKPSGLLVVLANEPPPVELAAESGAGFRLVDSMEYPSETRSRYFWALSVASAPSIVPLNMSLVANSSA